MAKRSAMEIFFSGLVYLPVRRAAEWAD